MSSHKLVLLRHGDSEWNNKKLFCGWYDSDLSALGLEEAKKAGQMLKEGGYTFDVAYTSVLKRAIKTLNIIQNEIDLHWIPVYRHWRLNERMYGALQGLNKPQTAAKHGEEQVKMWRRSFDVCPPPVDITDKHWPGHDPRYAMVDKSLIPTTECLRDTMYRVLPYWFDVIVPCLKRGEHVLVCAHGTSLRALIKHLDKLSDDEITKVEVPTGIPLVYELNSEVTPMKHYYLADEQEVKVAIEKIANQIKDTVNISL